jgi:hypothetical protein
LSYKIDGSIVSSNESYNKEINEVLNLNTPILKESRKNAWEAVKKELIAQKGEKPWNKSILFKYINKYSSKTRKDGKLKLIQYCGVVLYFLQKKFKSDSISMFFVIGTFIVLTCLFRLYGELLMRK